MAVRVVERPEADVAPLAVAVNANELVLVRVIDATSRLGRALSAVLP
ncbi:MULTISPECIES: hypothetical protein [unclassified Solwaraspora]